jgi:hypothetical protein
VQIKTTVQNMGAIDTSGLNVLKLVGEALSSTTYENLKLDALSISESSLTRCTFKNIETRSASFGGGRKQSLYTDCVFEQCDFEVSVAGNARFIGCEFKSCKLVHIFGVALELIDCTFPSTTIRSSVFHGKVPADSPLSAYRKLNVFRDNDFSLSELIDTDFRGGIELVEHCMPRGRGYFFVDDIPRALHAAEVLANGLTEHSDQKSLHKFTRRLTFAQNQGQKSTFLLTSELGALEDEWRRIMAGKPAHLG